MKFLGNFSNGRFIKPGGTLENFVDENPGDLSHPIGSWASSDDCIDSAAEAAKKAFSPWSSLDQKKRGAGLLSFSHHLTKHSSDLASLITQEMGKPLAESKGEVSRIISKTRDTVREKNSLTAPIKVPMEEGLTGYSYYRPRGVIAILSPFNVPAYLAMSQAVTALFAGNTVIIKPSEITPFAAQLLSEVVKKSGLPPGVLNIVHGRASVGQKLVAHPAVRGVFFTGSWKTGCKIQTALAKHPEKLLALEMGGKNASLVMKDADMGRAVKEVFTSAFLTSGQRCNATSRVILERHCAKAFLGYFLKKVDAIRIGYGFDKNVEMGPLASAQGFRHYLKSLAAAPKEGFEVLRKGGSWKHPDRKGYYVTPSVHLREGAPSSPVRDGNYADSEILGPNVAVYIVRNLEEAIFLNNRPDYGLVTSVFTRSNKNFKSVLKSAESGLVNWNAGTVRSSTQLPFGGLKQSGNGRPVGSFASLHCVIPTASVVRHQ